MTIPVSAELLIALNKEHGGPGAGVADKGGVESCAARPFSGYGEIQAFPTLWEKAAALLHGISSTQNFTDGNKRTAVVATLYFLEQNGETLRELPRISKEAAVLSVATSLLSVQETAEWLYVNRLRAVDRVEYAVLSFIEDIEPMNPDELRHQFPARIMGHHEVPVLVRYGIHTRLSWHEIDAGTKKNVQVRIESDSAVPTFIIDRSIVEISETVQRVPTAQWAPRGLQVWIPTFIVTLGLDESFDGYLKIFIDDEEAWQEHVSFAIEPGLKPVQ